MYNYGEMARKVLLGILVRGGGDIERKSGETKRHENSKRNAFVCPTRKMMQGTLTLVINLQPYEIKSQ